MSGWKRLGIVLSVIWFVGFFGWIWVDTTNHNGDFYSSMLRMCDLIEASDNEVLQYLKTMDEVWKKQAENHEKNKRCWEEAKVSFYQQSNESRSPAAISLILGVDAAALLIFWLIGWGILSTVRWVARGFSP